MHLFFGLASLPLWLSGILVLGCTTALAVSAPIYVRRRVGFERLVVNNEVAGFKYATLGVVYAVLLGFAVISVWEDFQEAEEHVENEAASSEVIYGLSGGLAEAEREGVRQALLEYATTVVEQEWPAMARGEESPAAKLALDNLYRSILEFEPTNARESAILAALLSNLVMLNDDRRGRIVKARGLLPLILELLLVLGAVLTVGFTLFFGAQNVRAQAAMTGILCIMIMFVLFTTLSLTHPFTGEVSVSPEPIRRAIADYIDE